MKAGCSRPLPSLSPCLASTDTTVSVLPACGSSPMLFLSPFGGVRHERFQYPIRASKCYPCQARSCALAPGCTISEKGRNCIRWNRRRQVLFWLPAQRRGRLRGRGGILAAVRQAHRSRTLGYRRAVAADVAIYVGAHAGSTPPCRVATFVGIRAGRGPAAILWRGATDFGTGYATAWRGPNCFAVRASGPVREPSGMPCT